MDDEMRQRMLEVDERDAVHALAADVAVGAVREIGYEHDLWDGPAIVPDDFRVEPVEVSGRDHRQPVRVLVREPDGARFEVRIVAQVRPLPDLDGERRALRAWAEQEQERARNARERPVVRRNGTDVSASFRFEWWADGSDWPDHGWAERGRGAYQDWPGGWVGEALERVDIDRVNGRLTYGFPDPWVTPDPDNARPVTISFEPLSARDSDRGGGCYFTHRLLVPAPAVRPAPFRGFAPPDLSGVADPPTDSTSMTEHGSDTRQET